VLQHVALEIRRSDLEPSLQFWRLLGFEQVEPPETLREAAAWVSRGPTQIHLFFADEPVAPPSGHAAVVVDDWARVIEDLRRAGFEPDERRRHWGAARAFVRGPGGHRVEVMEAPPPG
jgi:catechol 2,3-dioxygenase-like lactoylglutathione lyase family enzyme